MLFSLNIYVCLACQRICNSVEPILLFTLNSQQDGSYASQFSFAASGSPPCWLDRGDNADLSYNEQDDGREVLESWITETGIKNVGWLIWKSYVNHKISLTESQNHGHVGK